MVICKSVKVSKISFFFHGRLLTAFERYLIYHCFNGWGDGGHYTMRQPKLIQSASLLNWSLARISLSVVSNGQVAVAPLLSSCLLTTYLLLMHEWFYQHHQSLSIMERVEIASLIGLRCYKLDEIELKLTIVQYILSRVSNILLWEEKWILRLCATTHKGTERPILTQLQPQMSDWTRDWQLKKLLRR
jgi:hypothetical protein